MSIKLYRKPTGGGGTGSMTLLGSGSGSLTVTASASNLDTVSISGLTNLDRIYVVYSFDATSSNDDGRWLLYQATTGDIIIRADNNENLGGSYIAGSSLISQNAQTDTIYNSIATIYNGNIASGATYGNTQGGLTAWTGSWDLALRHTPAGTGSGTAYWSWAVYKLSGQ